ncbi:MAG: hypothetical protein ACOCP8_02960 [archaeon]
MKSEHCGYYNDFYLQIKEKQFKEEFQKDINKFNQKILPDDFNELKNKEKKQYINNIVANTKNSLNCYLNNRWLPKKYKKFLIRACLCDPETAYILYCKKDINMTPKQREKALEIISEDSYYSLKTYLYNHLKNKKLHNKALFLSILNDMECSYRLSCEIKLSHEDTLKIVGLHYDNIIKYIEFNERKLDEYLDDVGWCLSTQQIIKTIKICLANKYYNITMNLLKRLNLSDVPIENNDLIDSLLVTLKLNQQNISNEGW